MVPVANQAANKARAHPPQPDHPQLHRCVRGHHGSPYRSRRPGERMPNAWRCAGETNVVILKTGTNFGSVEARERIEVGPPLVTSNHAALEAILTQLPGSTTDSTARPGPFTCTSALPGPAPAARAQPIAGIPAPALRAPRSR